MPKVVMKFGGGVLQSVEDFQTVSEIIMSRRAKSPDQMLAIVVSAVYGVTDKLIKAREEAVSDATTVDRNLEELRQLHMSLIAGIPDELSRSALADKITESFHPLSHALHAVAERKAANPAEADFIDSFGERISCLLLAAYLRAAAVPASALSSEEAGLVTDGIFGNARPLISQVERNLNERVLPLLKEGIVVVLTGFYGVSVSGEVTTFGRGGSDYSAAIVATCLGADWVEIWKNVPGFMRAHPKIVADAEMVPKLSYDEAEELSYFGAEILHPRTMGPLRQKSIICKIKNVAEPEAPGTLISQEREQTDEVIKSIAVKRDIALLNVKGAQLADTPGFAAEIFSAMGDSGISVDAIATSQTDISFTIARDDLPKAAATLDRLEKEQLISHWCYEDRLALVGVVGEGLRATPGVAGRLFTVLAAATPPINIEMISMGASEINLSFVVKDDRAEECVRAVHEEFFRKAKEAG